MWLNADVGELHHMIETDIYIISLLYIILSRLFKSHWLQCFKASPIQAASLTALSCEDLVCNLYFVVLLCSM